MSDRFPGSELNASIPILWRCFHFHAYFPFPQKPERLDYPAFQRAIALLAAGGNLRLGDNADGITIDVDRYPNANARAEKQLWIMFKSLSIRIPQPTESESIETSEANLSTTEEDLMDVLCLAQPHDPCIMPAPIEELRPHAKRILNSSRPYACSSIPRGDFLTLIKLLLSTQMNKPVRFSQVHTARTFPTLAIDLLDGLANSVVDRFSSNENGEIDWHGFNNVMSTYLVR